MTLADYEQFGAPIPPRRTTAIDMAEVAKELAWSAQIEADLRHVVIDQTELKALLEWSAEMVRMMHPVKYTQL